MEHIRTQYKEARIKAWSQKAKEWSNQNLYTTMVFVSLVILKKLGIPVECYKPLCIHV